MLYSRAREGNVKTPYDLFQLQTLGDVPYPHDTDLDL